MSHGSTPWRSVCVSAIMGLALADGAEPARWPWDDPQAKVLPTGDLEWTPEPFAYQAGDAVRYIDFEGGEDANPGTREKPWRHHPWDPAAQANAAAGSGDTYVFKRGVMYRGALAVKQSGKSDNPIRLTTHPEWGRGAAVIAGSERVTGWRRGAEHADIAEAAAQKVGRAKGVRNRYCDSSPQNRLRYVKTVPDTS